MRPYTDTGESAPIHAGRAPAQSGPLRRPPRSLGSFIGGYKSAVAKRINALRDTPRAPVWQRNYYERIIRGERELENTRQYIIDNPACWNQDEENADRRSSPMPR